VLLAIVVMTEEQRPVHAQDDRRLEKIERRLTQLEERVGAADGPFDFIKVFNPAVFPILGIGLFCGLWARNSGRDFWVWFAAGLVFNIFTLIAVLDAHEKDKKAKKNAEKLAVKEGLEF
jgi:hypothetical protein